MSDLFIPEKIRVGFQKRDDTYTGKLAYVIYYDQKGVLRKEKSWKTWRNDKIKPLEFDNNPIDGFVLNKGIQRFNWSHFGSNRSYIRIFDTRGIEFEITPENLIGILTETDCLRRGLESKFVYAWKGPELVLLPCSSEEYGKAKEFTERQGQNISARVLKPGCSYTTKKGDEVIYMGRFSWFEWDSYSAKSRVCQKKHIFSYPKKPKNSWEKKFFKKNDAKFLAVLNSPDTVQNYADLIDEWNGDIRSSVVESWKTRPLKPSAERVFARKKDRWNDEYLKRTVYTTMKDDTVTFWNLVTIRKSHWNSGKPDIRGYRLKESGTLNTKTMLYKSTNSRYHDYDDYSPTAVAYPKEDIIAKLSSFSEIDMVLTSGRKLHLEEIGSLAQ